MKMTREEVVHAAKVGRSIAEANLRGLELRGADLRGADMRGADIRQADLYGANLAATALSGANLGGANLRCAILRRADLEGADLSGADLSGANLSGASLYGANLNSAELAGADLRRTDIEATKGLIMTSGIGSTGRTVYAWHGPAGWVIQAGCWEGTPNALRERIADNPWPWHSDQDVALWSAQYSIFCDLVEASGE